MGRLLKWSLLGLPLFALLAMVAILALAFSSQPTVTSTERLTPDLISRAQALFREHNPRRVRGPQVRVADIDGTDLNLMASYAASRLGIALAIDVGDGRSAVRASVPTVWTPFGHYLNIAATIPESSGVPRATDVTIGSLPLPDAIANWGLHQAFTRWYAPDGEHLATDMIRSVSMRDGHLRIEYQWRRDAADRMRAIAVPTEDAERLRMYHERLVTVVRDFQGRRSMIELLTPLMDLARTRTGDGADPVLENRAALTVAAFYVAGVDMAALVADAERWPRARRRVLLLRGRQDLAQHFLVSAVITAAAGTPLSEVVGLSKEIDDSRGGSGFSFSDIAADRAGTAFGALAVGSARQLHERIAAGLSESDLMPDVTGLVDNMPEAEFIQRFGGVDAPAYQRVLDDIDRRIATCRLHRG